MQTYSAPRPRRGSILLMLLGIITVTLVIAFAFLRSMQISRGTTLVQRKDELAQLAAEMGLHHAFAVCTQEYGMTSEVRDDAIVPPLSHLDAPSQVVFQPLARRSPTDLNSHPPTSYDLSPDVAFQNLFHCFYGLGGRTVGFSNGVGIKPGYARLFEANRFHYQPSTPNAPYDPSTYDGYTPDTPNPAVVQSAFPPADPFVRGANITPRHVSDHPLLLNSDCRPVVNAKDARFRLRYAIDIKDMSGSLWLNTDMPWMDAAQKAQARSAYKEAVYAVGTQLSLGYSRSDSFENIYLGHGAYANSLFVNGQPRDWPERGGVPMWFRAPDQNGNVRNGRAFHNVHGSPFMNWNDPGGNWLGSVLPSYNDLAFAMQGPAQNWHNSGETHDNEGRVRGDLVAQFCATPFGRPYEAGTDHPWELNALIVPPRVLEALVAAYMPPTTRSVAVTSETCTPYIQKVDAFGNVTNNWEGEIRAGIANPFTWSIPAAANLTISGSGPDLFTDAFTPGGQAPFGYPTPAMRDYWTTPVLHPAPPTTWRADHTAPPDVRTNADRYPGELFFSDPIKEKASQSLTLWRWLQADGVTPHDGVAADPRQTVSDPRQDPTSVVPAWSSGSNYVPATTIQEGGNKYTSRTTHVAGATNQPGVGATWTTDWTADYPAFTPVAGVDHLGRHIVFYKTDPGSTAALPHTNNKYLSAAYGVSNNLNNASEFHPSSPTGVAISGAGTDGRISPYKGSSLPIYAPNPAVPVNGEVYPNPTLLAPAAQVTFALTNPALRGPDGVITPSGWSVTHNAGSWGQPAKSVYPNSYFNRVAMAFWHAIGVAQQANLAWANPQDSRSQTVFSTAQSGVMYTSTPDVTNNASYVRKGKSAFKHGSDPKGSNQWNPAAADFEILEHLDRQFVANLGESFDRPGHRTPAESVLERPPRYTRNGFNSDANLNNFQNVTNMTVAEYRVSNNIRTLLTPVDNNPVTNAAGVAAVLTPMSTDAQTGGNEPPHKVWLLDEWNVGADGAYTPGSTVGNRPTAVAIARAKMMERVLNDWRLSFFGASKDYQATFRPKDFDGDGRVFCSGYLGGASVDTETGLTCWKLADGSGNGPGQGAGLTIYSVTGCLTLTRSHQFKIHVRGELYDNFLDRAVSEKYLESTYLIDPDENISRGGLNTGLEDSVIIQQRPIHNYYRGYLDRHYP